MKHPIGEIGFMDKFITIVLMVWITFTPIKASIAQAPDSDLREKSISEIVDYYFGDNAKTMKAIFMAESRLNPTAKNWNCRYTNEVGKPYSTSCKTVDDRKNAWSVDCGIAQINFRGTNCPSEAYDVIHNMELAREKLEKEGLRAWSVYNNGIYKKFL